MFAIDKFKFDIIKEDGCYGSYTVGPLPKGYGLTVGNTFRRILLSSIEGAAVTSVKVKGAKHEYSTISGVADDILTILLRIKQLALCSHSDKSQKIDLNVKGRKLVKAKDIKLTAAVELANPELVITELTKKSAVLDIQMQVEKGRGYFLSDESKRSSLGVLPLDANFSPVKRVILSISRTRVGQQTDLDRIDLEIYTNKAISPKEAMEQAVDIYKTISDRLSSVVRGEIDDQEAVPDKKVSKKQRASSDLDISKLNLSSRLTNSLLKSGYKNLTKLEGKTVDEITGIRGLGKKSAEELMEIMKGYKLKVGN